MKNNKAFQLEDLYLSHLKEHDYRVDPAQIEVVRQLQSIAEILTTPRQKQTWLSRLRLNRNRRKDKANIIQGFYLWGGVGRGKTHIIDFFYEVLPVEKKLRLHYYQFMQEVHAALKKITNRKDPLKIVAEQFARRTRVLFLDEFFVSDITDAMILYGLLSALFEHQIMLITTSNFAPQELYKDGLQRQRFLPAITLIEQRTKVVGMQEGVDYRTLHIKSSGCYHWPCNEQSEILMKRCFTTLAAEVIGDSHVIEINSRNINAIMHTPNIVWFEFKEICQTPRSVADYITIARLYHTVLISDVPVFDNCDDAARRFIQLVDEFYDQNVILILSAAAQAEQLYKRGNLSFEFGRTSSRLLEMQSRKYWSKARTN